MKSGNLVFILHTHLPYVLNHGDWPHGEDWLTEAIAECYIPLLNVVNDLDKKGIAAKLTFDISPILCEQLENEYSKEQFIAYCDAKIKSAKEDEIKFKKWGYDPHHIYLAGWWANWFQERKDDFINKYNRSIIGEMKRLQDRGLIEIMTCGATHGYFALLSTEESINLQIKLAVENYKKHFGRQARGIWLPECSYRPSYEWKSYLPIDPFDKTRLRPGIEQFLSQNGIEYFVTDQMLLDSSQNLGWFADDEKKYFLSKYYHPNQDEKIVPTRIYNVSSSENTEFGTAAVFTRHRDLAMKVWSAEVGYPGEPNYLDFHKKQNDSMLRYWRVTDIKTDMAFKSLYHPDWIYEKIDLQVHNFVHNLENSSNYANYQNGEFTTVCTPFDTELFGHWWFEGPEFIRKMIESIHDSPHIGMATASEQLDFMKPKSVIRLQEGSWGKNNNHDVWMNAENKWTWELLYNAENRWKTSLQKCELMLNDDQMQDILKQALRELLLAQASDWQFLITTWSARDYAEMRLFNHISDFNRLLDMAENFAENKKVSKNEKDYLQACKQRNDCFPELDLDWRKDLRFFS